MSESLADSSIMITSSEVFVLGSSLTWNGVAKCGYFHVEPNPDAFAAIETHELGGGVLVDIDRDGAVRGIETLGHEVGMADLLRVVRWMNEKAS